MLIIVSDELKPLAVLPVIEAEVYILYRSIKSSPSLSSIVVKEEKGTISPLLFLTESLRTSSICSRLTALALNNTW